VGPAEWPLDQVEHPPVKATLQKLRIKEDLLVSEDSS
jgi:hypothetical protein